MLWLTLAVMAPWLASCEDESPELTETADSIANRPQQAPQLASRYEEEAAKAGVSAVRGAGYSYRPNTNYCMGTDMEVFNMPRLYALQLREYAKVGGASLICDDYNPVSKQTFYSSQSVDALNRQISAGINGEFFFTCFSLDLSVNFNKAEQSVSESVFCLQHMTRNYFTREVYNENICKMVYDSIMASAVSEKYYECNVATLCQQVPFFPEVYSLGFAQVMQEFVISIHSTDNIAIRANLCKDFISTVGSAFVVKSCLGLSFDCYTSMNRNEISSDIDLEAAMNVVIHANMFTIDADADVMYSEDVKKMISKSNTQMTARGGEIGRVTALTTGQKATIALDDFVKWEESLNAANAALVDIKLVPICNVIYDPVARAALYDFMCAYYEHNH